MSRGPGALQQRIIGELAAAPAKYLSHDDLKKRFPREAKSRTLQRAIRSLLDRGLVYELSGRRYIALSVAADVELQETVRAALSMLALAARARGLANPSAFEAARRELARRQGRQDT